MKTSVFALLVLTGCAAGDDTPTIAMPGGRAARSIDHYTAPDGRDLPIRDVGLPVGLASSSGVPPLGEGVAPASGIGGDGAAAVTQVGGWSGGPGAVRWHGGQWMIPYEAMPGSTLLNVSCDVVPRADATALVEVVSSNGQVLGSVSVPAATGVVIRAWAFLGTHAISDGEQAVVRISPRDSTGAWTSAGQDMTVVSCAVNTISASSPLPTVTYTTVPSRLFAAPDINIGVNGQVFAVAQETGLFMSATIAGQCGGGGFIIACARIRERGPWNWCSPPVACIGSTATSAVVPLSSPIQLSASQHVDIALMSGPTTASMPFGVYTTM